MSGNSDGNLLAQEESNDTTAEPPSFGLPGSFPHQY
jgi:hypothetical protein